MLLRFKDVGRSRQLVEKSVYFETPLSVDVIQMTSFKIVTSVGVERFCRITTSKLTLIERHPPQEDLQRPHDELGGRDQAHANEETQCATCWQKWQCWNHTFTRKSFKKRLMKSNQTVSRSNLAKTSADLVTAIGCDIMELTISVVMLKNISVTCF